MLKWIKRRLDLWALSRSLHWDREYLRVNGPRMSPQERHIREGWIKAKQQDIEKLKR
jgi:hypothetical protein